MQQRQTIGGKPMNVTSNFSTSASALAFFLGPMAWIQPCPEIAALDEKPGIASGNISLNPENTPTNLSEGVIAEVGLVETAK
jgi:hypothetical protein